jgi:arylsulfatase A-like enzyme
MSPRTTAPVSAREVFLLAAWFGILGGIVEGIGHYALQELDLMHWRMSLVPVSIEIVWISVAFDLLLSLVAAGVILGIARLLPRLPWRTIAFFLFALAMTFDWLWIAVNGRMRAYSAGILALGLAAMATRWFAHHGEALLGGMRRNLRWAIALAALAFVTTQGGVWINEKVNASRLPSAPADAPNVLVIVVDALRADHLSAYGYSRVTSPNLDRLAQQGVLFERTYSPSSWTPPSHASLLTGRYLFEHRAEEKRLDDRFPVLPQVLERRGYRTAAISANTFYFCRRAGFGRGFLRFDDNFYSVPDRAWRTLFGRLFDLHIFRPLGFEDVPARRYAADVNAALLNWLDNTGRGPFFAMLNYYDAHDPYLPVDEYARKFLRKGKPSAILNWIQQRRSPWLTREQLQEEIDAYDGGIAYADAQIAALRDELERRGLLQNTILVVTSDHGEAFGDHQVYLHRNSLYVEEIRVPLIFSWPQRLPEGLRISVPVSNSHLAATLFDLTGSRDKDIFPGPSLAQFWRDPQGPAEWPMPLSEMRDFEFAAPKALAYDGGVKSLVSGDWHFLLHETRGVRLFNLRDDPQERHDLSATPEGRRLCDEFLARLERVLRGERQALLQPVSCCASPPGKEKSAVGAN